jgi:Fur family ferric uptake transcriptional regulator
VTDETLVLREKDIHVTAQRLAVLRSVGSQSHLSADAIYAIVEHDIGAVSRQAIYDTLTLLVEKGLLRRIQPVGSPALYENRVDDNHHHLICRICGRVVDVDCAVGATPCLSAADDVGFEIDEAEVVYWGRCPECQQQGRLSTRLDPTPNRRQRKFETSATPRTIKATRQSSRVSDSSRPKEKQ